jgi:hypothetical protein
MEMFYLNYLFVTLVSMIGIVLKHESNDLHLAWVWHRDRAAPL